MSECIDLQMFKIANAKPDHRYFQLDRPKEHVQEIIKDLLDLGKWNNAHFGETIHVVGCGPSARNFAPLAKGCTSIGVNGAGVVIPEITYWLACDPIESDRPLNNAIRDYLKTNTYLQHKFQYKLSWKRNPLTECHATWTLFGQTNELLLRHDKPHWRNGFFFYHSSVHAAMELARLMGARKIVLWGLDYNDRSHCYTGKEIIGDCKDNPDKPWDDFDAHLSGFKRIAEHYKKENIEVINANPESKLDVFPKQDYALDNLDKRSWQITWRMYATRDSDYVDIARENARKFAEYELGVKVDLYDKSDTWMKNCLQRPAMLLKAMEAQQNYAIGLLDGDVEPVADPELLKSITCGWDVMVRFRGPEKEPWDRYCAGYVAFANTPLGRKTLETWAEICNNDPEPDQFCREQKYLCDAIEKVKPQIMELPKEYDFVPPKKWNNQVPEGTVLLHLPASRKLLKVMGGKR